MEGCSPLCGIVTGWTVPRRDREGYASVLSLLCDDTTVSLSVTLQSLEDHNWYNAQRVVARDVVLTPFCKGERTPVFQWNQKRIFLRTFPLWT